MSNGDLVSPYAEEPQPQPQSEAAPQGPVCACMVHRAAYGLVAVLVLGAAGVYGAVTVRPELAEYMSFLPGLKSDVPACGAILSSGCSSHSCSATSGPSACSAISRATAAVAETCPMIEEQRQAIVLSDAVFAESAAEQVSEPAASENAEPAPSAQAEATEPRA